MNRFFIERFSLFGVGFILFIQLTTIVYSLKCPVNLSKECNCVDQLNLALNCSKNNEAISMISTYEIIGLKFIEHIEFRCENVSDGEILKSFNFDFNHNINVKWSKIDLCPLSAFALIQHKVINHMKNLTQISAYHSFTTAMPETTFND